MRGAVSLSLLAVCLAAAAARGAESQVGVYANIRPGKSLKAEVDLHLGEPLRKLDDYVYEYASPRGVPDTERIVAAFFPDTREVSRLDIYLKTSADAELLRSEFGTRVMARDREDGQFEELFFPKLHAVIFADGRNPVAVKAIGYISPRLMADYFADRVPGLLRDQHHEEAQTEADKAVLVDPEYARGYIEQSECWISRKNYNEAIVSLIAGTKAERSPKYQAAAHARLGALYWREKNWADKARPEFLKALALAANLDEAHFLYGEFLQAQKQKQEALAEFTAAVQLNPRNVSARTALAAAHYSESEYAKALPHYAELSAWVESGEAAAWRDESKADIHFRYGNCLRRTNKLPEAVEAYRQALDRSPRMVAGWHHLGFTYHTAGDFAKAIENYRKGLELDPKHGGLTHSLAIALLESGQPEEARQQMELVLRLIPNDASPRFTMARCWGALGKKKQTIYWIQEAVAAGYKDRTRLTSDRFLAKVQKDGDFKKILQGIP
jgi:tetratricopeptide (TPR) repeat protein